MRTEKAEDLRKGSKLYPVHYSGSDTSGEKPFEEFVTETETADMDRFLSLGVITGKDIPDRRRVEVLFRLKDEEMIREMIEILNSGQESEGE